MRGKKLHWRSLVANGRIKKRAVESPPLDVLYVRHALNKLGLRYWQAVNVWNPDFTGMSHNLSGALQWLDFVVVYKKRLFVILLYGRPAQKSNMTLPRFIEQLEAKKALLARKKIPVLLLKRKQTVQEFQILISIFIRRNMQS